MKILKKTGIFWGEILEMIPWEVSLRTISTKHRKKSEAERPDYGSCEVDPGKTKELFPK